MRIQRTIPGSPARAAGLREGDVILAVDGVAVAGREHLNQLFDASRGNATLTVQREGVSRSVSLGRGPADPVFLGLVNAAETQECREVRVGELTPEQRSAVGEGAFDARRGFRCEDAHVALAPAFGGGDLLMIRGGRRILLTMPRWSTVCVSVSDYDGASLTATRLRALVDVLAAAYVADRHANP